MSLLILMVAMIAAVEMSVELKSKGGSGKR